MRERGWMTEGRLEGTRSLWMRWGFLWRWSFQRHARSRELALVQVWGRR